MVSRAIAHGSLALCLIACAGDAPSDREARIAESGVVDSGTRVDASIQTALSSRTDVAGAAVRAVVSRDVMDGLGGVAIPAGSDVHLSVAQLDAGTASSHPDGRLALRIESVTVNSRAHPITAMLDQVPHHLEWRGTTAAAATEAGVAQPTYRDVVVSAGTPIVFTLAKAMKVTAR